MTQLLGAWTQGLVLSMLALGVFISFRVFSFPDITADGSFALGAAVAATLIVAGVDPFLASGAGFLAGVVAGATTGVLHVKFKIHGLLAGILVMTALYSVNLRIMGRSNIPMPADATLAGWAETVALKVVGSAPNNGSDVTRAVSFLGWEIPLRDLAVLGCVIVLNIAACSAMYMFLRTNLGTAMRATGDNAQMIRALGVNVDTMMILGLALANGMVALSGALFAQLVGFADVQMGIGMVVRGLASVIIGEALVSGGGLGLTITATVLGSVLFNLLTAIALRVGLQPNDLKLAQAVFVFLALVTPNAIAGLRARKARESHA